jgi:transcriptional regulator with GAF, ATPase, and Fis domain
MRSLYPVCARLARSDVAVVIEGETGTGKEVLAEALHEASLRAAGPFVVFDCTAVPASLLESALFGHERGAFTGALAQHRGAFEEAHGGTLFIDEIGELEPYLQPKLLRAIERGEVQRVGSGRWQRVDVRILAATRRNLDQEVRGGRFRDDLFFRLAVGRIELPPLRQRSGDVALLAAHFWRQMAAGSPPASFVRRLELHAWPGNVRELRNAVARQVLLGDALETQPAATGGAFAAARTDAIDQVLALDLPLSRARAEVVEEFERRYVAARARPPCGARRACRGIVRRRGPVLPAAEGQARQELTGVVGARAKSFSALRTSRSRS